MKQMRLWLDGLLLGLLLLAACSYADPKTPAPTAPVDPPTATPLPAPPTATPEPLAALVNNEPILLADYERQVARIETSMIAAGQDPNSAEGQAALTADRAWVLNILIEQRLIVQAARAAGITVTDAEVDANIQALSAEVGEASFQQWLNDQMMTLEELRATLRDEMIATRILNQVVEQVPTRAEHIQVRHILVFTEAEAQQILGQLQAGGDFAALAGAYSQDLNTRDNGGDLGYFPRGVLTAPEVEAAAFELQPGQIGGIVPSNLGFHLIQVVTRTPDMEVSPENLRLLQDKAVRDWLDGLRGAASIQRFVETTP
ncbi:MAG TPA: peptidylprolyl isomerase [Anaerolineae bacterium]|nr:peptidylprolyl isomerase [Anaerolineae bacterium]